MTAAGDLREAREIEAVLAWSDARRGDAASARRRLSILREAAEDDDARFTSLIAEARVAAVLGDWRRAVELRRETVRMAMKLETRAAVIQQRVDLARALHGLGARSEVERLVAELLPEVERVGLHGLARDLRKLRAT